VQRRRHLDDSNLQERIDRPCQDVPKRRTIDWRVPLDHDQLCLQTHSTALRYQAVDKRLEPSERIATVVVIARRDHDTQVRLCH
jgi:hypothetical protein